HRPTSDRFLVTVVDPRHAWMKSVRSRIESGVRSVFLRKTDLTPIGMSNRSRKTDLTPIGMSNRSRETVEGGVGPAAGV
ncbi:hypothetical protein, partial [Stenotrophomonas maltophilia]|uniref:hypothetical protein n=1 Tax=Stenotrophomonas maltophilia TaxID=40324 RepID=UPI0039AF080F